MLSLKHQLCNVFILLTIYNFREEFINLKIFFLEVQQFGLLGSPLLVAVLTAILEYGTLNNIIWQNNWKTDTSELFLHLFQHSLKTSVAKYQHNKNCKKKSDDRKVTSSKIVYIKW